MTYFRNLSGIFFREKINGKMENVCFEELSKEKQDEILESKEPELIKKLAKMLADTLIEIGNQLDLKRD